MGSSIATAPTFDIMFVNKIVKIINPKIIKNIFPPVTSNIRCTIQAPAPVSCIPTPSVIAPPYSNIIPQGTLFSTSFHVILPVRNNKILPNIEITASPKYSGDEKKVHRKIVKIKIKDTIISLLLIFPAMLT